MTLQKYNQKIKIVKLNNTNDVFFFLTNKLQGNKKGGEALEIKRNNRHINNNTVLLVS